MHEVGTQMMYVFHVIAQLQLELCILDGYMHMPVVTEKILQHKIKSISCLFRIMLTFIIALQLIQFLLTGQDGGRWRRRIGHLRL